MPTADFVAVRRSACQWLEKLGCNDQEHVGAPQIHRAPASTPAAPPTPKTPRGLIVYSTANADKSGGTEPLWLLDAESGTVTRGPVDQANQLVVGPHVVAGRHGSGGAFWTLDLRAPTMTLHEIQPVDFITPDNRLVYRDGGTPDQPFKIVISDANGENKKELLSEPAADRVGIVTGAGKDLVHGSHTRIGKQPPFSIEIATGKRTDYPGLEPKVKDNEGVADLVYSPNGTKAASCYRDLTVKTFTAGAKPQKFPLGGNPRRCQRRFSQDDAYLACAILPEKHSKGATDDLVLFHLAANKRTVVVKGIGMGDFAFAPDGTEIAYVVPNEAEQKWGIRVVSLDGKKTRDLWVTTEALELIHLVGWTHPIGG